MDNQSQEFPKQITEFFQDMKEHHLLHRYTDCIKELFFDLRKLDFPLPENCYVIDDEFEMYWKTRGILISVEFDCFRFAIIPNLVNRPDDIKVFHIELPTEDLEKASAILLNETLSIIQKY